MSRSAGALLLCLILGLSSAARLAAADEQQSIEAFSAWQARGQIFETGESRSTFVGSFIGAIYIKSGEGPIDSGFMTCPTIVDMNTTDGKETATGRCTITAKDGSRVYADISCKGVQFVGCNGDFTITGGTDRFKGITGGGPINIRSDVRDMAMGAGNIVNAAAAGIILWPKLVYKLP
jgi:hypothetical protein